MWEKGDTLIELLLREFSRKKGERKIACCVRFWARETVLPPQWWWATVDGTRMKVENWTKEQNSAGVRLLLHCYWSEDTIGSYILRWCWNMGRRCSNQAYLSLWRDSVGNPTNITKMKKGNNEVFTRERKMNFIWLKLDHVMSFWT